ncbi:methionine ABC transporter ATP-binding protein [Streptococcus halichoeri]|uniref:methionine ABC transporter ATP-binding protein n=1 Tax=Streptococcus halichoeri TaxID=254785 RepID=UPI00135AAE2F|nr:methionine ABC transporter ATP-binding protein [Streptococcus halichoeri]
MDNQAMISLENIGITFYQGKQEINAVQDVNLTIHQGEIYGIVGYSGAGKSTLVRVINALQIPNQGRVVVDGETICNQGRLTLSDRALRDKRRQIGMIFQHFNLMAQKTARENIAFALKHSGLSKAKKAARVTELLELVGLADRADNYPAQLSGGQKQRVAIARALANDPKILISDESTSALDPQTTKQILHLLKSLNQRLGLTIVLITHEMQIVKDICTKVAVMQAGQVIEEGRVLDIFSKPKEPLTKDFIHTATGTDEALEKIYQQEVVQNMSKNALLLQLNYTGSITDEPILNQIYRQHRVSSNVLFGNIQILDGTPVGELITLLEGQPQDLIAAQQALRDAGVSIELLKEGV